METAIATSPPDEASSPASTQPASRGILLVVDDPDLQARLAKRFSRSGYHVVGAPSAEAAAAVCVRWSPDVVLLDETVRGGHSGREIARALQRRVPGLRAVILGASDGTFDKVDAIAAAAATLVADVGAAARKPVTAPVTSPERTPGSARRSRSSARRR